MPVLLTTNMTQIVLLVFIVTAINVCLTFPRDARNANVVGGTTAEPGQFPSIVSIRETATDKHYCTGTIVGNSWVITTAFSMVLYGQPGHFYIVAGSNDLTQGGTTYNITVVKMYPTFEILSPRENIALLRIQGAFEIGDTLQVAEIGEAAENDTAIVAGWGQTSTVVQFASETVLSSDECSRMMVEPVRTVCADGGRGVGVDSVEDWGAPLFVDGKFVGVGYDGSRGLGPPDMFMRVSYYLDWITQSVQ